MRSEDIETLSYAILGTCFLSLELYGPHVHASRTRTLGLDLLGGGVGLLAVVIGRAALKALCNRSGCKELMVVSQLAPLPSVFKIVLALVCVDFCLYWIHRLMHLGAFWRAHVLHHTIESMNWIAGMRTSAVHALLFTLPQVIVPFYVFGASQIEGGLTVSGVIFAQIFIHSNIDVGLGWVGSWILVTPNSHRIHHGFDVVHDRNFGSVFIFWDRLFGTWLAPNLAGNAYRLGLGSGGEAEARRVRTLLGV